MTGSAIHFGMPHDVLCVAEGIETALSVQVATGYPCWAAVSAQGLQDVLIPEGVKTVLIFADKEPFGYGTTCGFNPTRKTRQRRVTCRDFEARKRNSN